MNSVTGSSRGLLRVKGEESLDEFGRFFHAMLLDLLRDPDKDRMLRKMNVSVAIEPKRHPESALTITFRGGIVVLESGAARDAEIRLNCTGVALMKLARVPAGPRALKFMSGPAGREIITELRSGDLKIHGIARHPRGMMRFANFLAPAESSQKIVVGRGYIESI